MWIEIGNLHGKVTRATAEEAAWIDAFLTFDDPKSYFTGYGDGKVRMFDKKQRTFATGFLTSIRKAAQEDGVKVDLFDRRVVPCVRDPAADLAWLRVYQNEAVDAGCVKGRGIIKCPTGSGKTEIAVGLTRALPGRWLLVVHRSGLMEQAAERYERRTGLEAGRIGEGRFDGDPKQPFVCATFQTLHARLKKPGGQAFLDSRTGVIIDEVHTLPAASFWQVAMSLPNAYYRIGLSATPLDRDDKRSQYAVAATGPIIYKISSKVLFDAGVLAKPIIRLVPVTQHAPDAASGSWSKVYNALVVKSQTRNLAVVDAAKRATKPCLIFVKEIGHGKAIQDLCEQAGMSIGFVWGKDSTTSRSDAVKRLVRGDLDVLIASVIFNEGIDVPELRSVVIASGGKSIIAALQRIGRGMRKMEGKDTFEVFDIDDRGDKWMDRHRRARLKAYAGEGYEVVVEPPSASQHLLLNAANMVLSGSP